MKHYTSLSELVKDKDSYPSSGRIFAQRVKFDDLANSEYWIVSSQEAKMLDYIEDERGARIPVSLASFDVKRLLDVQTFQDIIDNKLEHNPNLSLEKTDIFLEAIIYYLENDDFLD